MKIAFCCTDTPFAPWRDALQRHLPEAQLMPWTPRTAGASAPTAPDLADWAIVWHPPQAFFDEQTALRAVFNIGAGVDALLALRLPDSLPLVRLDDAGMGVQMAEYVCHALIRHTRRFDRYQAQQRQGQWQELEPLPRERCTVGVLGLGVLGAQVARAVQSFGYPVRGWSRSPKAQPGVEAFHGEAGLEPFLRACSVLVNLLPLTSATRGLLNRERLSWLPRGAYLINPGRGAHLVEPDLIGLLASGHLSGATLDVCAEEPPPASHPFWSHPAVTLTPHIAACTVIEDSAAQIAAKWRALQRGEAVAGTVDRARGY